MTAGRFPRAVVADHTEFLDRHLDGLVAQGIGFAFFDYAVDVIFSTKEPRPTCF